MLVAARQRLLLLVAARPRLWWLLVAARQRLLLLLAARPRLLVLLLSARQRLLVLLVLLVLLLVQAAQRLPLLAARRSTGPCSWQQRMMPWQMYGHGSISATCATTARARQMRPSGPPRRASLLTTCRRTASACTSMCV